MRKIIVGLSVAVGIAASLPLIAGTAAAEPYRWCAQYSGWAGGGTNCGFVTLAQCRATVSGIGGFCTLNRFYTGPNERRARKRHRG